MEDHFLYKLRNGQLQNNKGNYRSKKVKVSEHRKDGNINSDSHKYIAKLLEKLLDFQKVSLNCLEKITEFQDKQSETMAKIADALRLLNESKIINLNEEETHEFSSLPTTKKISPQDNYNKQTKSSKKKINEKGLGPSGEKALFETVKTLRADNKTWSTIANYLKKENIPTLTGNGTWSANLALYFYKKIISQGLNV